MAQASAQAQAQGKGTKPPVSGTSGSGSTGSGKVRTTMLPTPLARSMASTAPGGPKAPPPPASLANTQTPPFLTKLYNLVEDELTQELVYWTSNGLAFTVHKPDEFGRDVLPRYFKHNNFSSFVRQLNQYGFHKRDPDRWTFGHENFRRGRLDLLRLISRRRPKGASNSSTHVPHPSQVSQTTAPIELAVHGTSQHGQAVVELGNYGLAGKLEALQRDKEVLVKELVITRKAEQALQEKCDGLETRLEMLESSTKQMQSFILHYFSKVLQPYSEEIASRKRKRLPPAAPSPTDLIGSNMVEPTSNIAAGGAATAVPARLPAPTGSSLEALRHMMQQMQMTQSGGQAGVSHGTAHTANADGQFAPAIVQELMQDDVSTIGDVVMRTSPTPSISSNGFARPSVSVHTRTRARPRGSPRGKPQPEVTSPETSWTSQASNGSGMNGGTITTSQSEQGKSGDTMAIEDKSNAAVTNKANDVLLHDLDPVIDDLPPPVIDDLPAPVIDDMPEYNGPVQTKLEDEEVLFSSLDLEAFPPLDQLPAGTDMPALASHIESFGTTTEQ